MIRHNSPDLLLAPAHVLDGLASDIKYIEEVSEKVSMISFGGGPLSKPTSDILTKHFRVFGMYGTSEIGTIHKIIPSGPWDTRSWNSWKPHPKENMQFRHLQDDVYEVVIVRNNSLEEEQAVFQMFPKLKEYPTKDMFSPDPYREGFWSYRGRVDDLIKLSTGGTVNPSRYEEMVSGTSDRAIFP
jgi:acyl-coenzyme A synthetase/AMP-(fatty) acid ligase